MTIRTFSRNFNKRSLYVTLLGGVIAAALVIAADGATQQADQPHAGHEQAAAPAKLVQLVRDATKQFVNVNAATAAGYQPFLGCVSGPDHGAMGNHYVNGALVADGVLDASRPEVLIYEPLGGGLQLVGVEFVVLADAWLARRMLVDLVTRAQGRHRFFRPEVMLCVPAGAPGDQRRALIDAAITAGARQAWLIEAPLAAALGLGLPVAESSSQGICDIGGGLIQAAVVSRSGIAASHIVPEGGEQLDGRLAALLHERHRLNLDPTAVEGLKIAIGAAVALDEPLRAEIDATTVTSDELTRTVQAWLSNVVEAVRVVLDQTPRRLAARVAERGFLLIGGGALMLGVDRHLSRETGIPFQVAAEPRTCAVRGTRRGLGEFEVVRRRQLYLGGR